MEQRPPLLSYKVSILLWILLLSFWFIPKEKISVLLLYYILCTVALFISLILFLDAYNGFKPKMGQNLHLKA